MLQEGGSFSRGASIQTLGEERDGLSQVGSTSILSYKMYLWVCVHEGPRARREPGTFLDVENMTSVVSEKEQWGAEEGAPGS